MQIMNIDYNNFTQVTTAGDVIEHVRAAILDYHNRLAKGGQATSYRRAMKRSIMTLQHLLNSLILQDKKLDAWADLKGGPLGIKEKQQLANTELYELDQS